MACAGWALQGHAAPWWTRPGETIHSMCHFQATSLLDIVLSLPGALCEKLRVPCTGPEVPCPGPEAQGLVGERSEHTSVARAREARDTT